MNVNNTKKKKKPAALAMPSATGRTDPSPVKKRRVVDAGFDEDPDVTEFARQLRGGSRVAQTVAVPTPVFSESKTSAHLFGVETETARSDSTFVYPPVLKPTTTTAAKATVVATSAPTADARTAAKQHKMAQPSSQHALSPVPPLSETDHRYKTALIGFETAMKDDPSSHATDVSLKAVVDLLHGSEVLGDASLSVGLKNDTEPEDSEVAEERRVAELRMDKIVTAMAQLCHEQDVFDQAHGSSVLRWKLIYGAKKQHIKAEEEIETAAEEEAQAPQPARASVA